LADRDQATEAEPVAARLVLVRLLKADADPLGEFLLSEPERNATGPNMLGER